MPASIIASAVIGWLGGAAVVGAVAAAAITFGIRLVTTYVIANMFLKRPSSDANAAAQDQGVRVQLPPATNNKLPISYGVAWLKPIITDAKISTDQKTMWYVCALSDVPDSNATLSVGQIQWGDKTLNFDTTDQTKVVSWTNGAGQTDTAVDGLINVYRYINGSNNPQSGTPNSAITVLQDSAITSAERWTSTDVMTKTCFIIVKVQYNQDIGLTGLGDLTIKVTNSMSAPGDCILDYLQNERYGCAIPLTQINTQSLSDLNAYSAQQITYTPMGGGSAQQNRYEINGPLNPAQDCFHNLQVLVDSCDSWIQWNEAAAQWGVVINKAYDQSAGSQSAQTISQLFNLTDDVVIGSINLNPVDLNSTFNRVEVTYPETNIYDASGYAYLDLDEADRNPNEPDNIFSMTLQCVNNDVQAKYIATRRLIQSREDLVVQCSVDYSGIQIDAGDLVRFNSAKFQWVNKVFRVTQVQEVKDEGGFLGVSLTLTEYNHQVYENINISQFIPSPNTGITDPTIAATPAAPTVTNINNVSSIPNFQLNATIPSIGVYGAIEFWYSSTTDSLEQYTLLKAISPAGSSIFTAGQSISTVVTGLKSGTYYFRVRVLTTTNNYSSFSTASSSLVWGPTVDTPSSLGVNFEWSPAAIFVPADSTGGNVTVGQVGSAYLRIGPDIVQLWDKTGTQPNNTWYANTLNVTSGLTTGGLVADTTLDRVYFTVSGLTVDQATATVTDAFYKPSTGGNLVNLGTTSIQVNKVKSGATGSAGASGTQYATISLYQWAATQPGNPSGSSTYNWSTAVNSSYTGANGWQTIIPANPGTAGVKLWTVSKSISAAGGTTSTTVSWTSGYTVTSISQNGSNGTDGASGVQNAYPEVYQWAISTPTISGTSTYTWSTASFTGVPSGWSTTTPTAPSAGYTLWAAKVNLVGSASATTSTIDWTTAQISSKGYVAAGGSGTAGASSRRAYARVANNPQPISGQISVSGDNRPSQSQSSTTWGLNVTWNSVDPDPASSNSLYQTDGIYNPATDTTVWDTPYLSSLKVGSLSAITVNTGNLNINDTLTVATTGKIQGGQSGYNSGNGFFLGYDGSTYKFSIGNSSGSSLTWDGSALGIRGNIISSGATIGSNSSSGFWLRQDTGDARFGGNVSIGSNLTIQGVLANGAINTNALPTTQNTGSVNGFTYSNPSSWTQTGARVDYPLSQANYQVNAGRIATATYVPKSSYFNVGATFPSRLITLTFTMSWSDPTFGTGPLLFIYLNGKTYSGGAPSNDLMNLQTNGPTSTNTNGGWYLQGRGSALTGRSMPQGQQVIQFVDTSPVDRFYNGTNYITAMIAKTSSATSFTTTITDISLTVQEI